MADDTSTPTTTTNDDAQTVQAAPYSQFYAGPLRQLQIETKSNIAAPEIVADGVLARAGIDVVSNQEMTTLTGRQTDVYRSDPTKPAQNYDAAIGSLFLAANKDTIPADRSTASGPATPEADAALAQQVAALSAATGIDSSQIRLTTDRYQNDMAMFSEAMGKGFGVDPTSPPSPVTQEMGRMLARAALNGAPLPGDEAQYQADFKKFAADNHLSAEDATKVVQKFVTDTATAYGQAEAGMGKVLQNLAQEAQTSNGVAFTGDSLSSDKNYAVVPKVTGTDTRSLNTAWFLNPDDPPPKGPPGSKELGDFLVSLHESEHLSRETDVIAPSTMSDMARTQAGEIDADRAVMQFLNNEHDTASKNYWLQTRQVDSFTFGVMTNSLDHDTATFLRTQEATGKQLDLDKFDKEKLDLLARVNAKAQFTSAGPTNRAPTADVMGAVQDVLKDDKAQKDPAKKLSAMQVAEAQSFLADAQAMGYQANPDYPKAGAAPALASYNNTFSAPAAPPPAGPKV